MYVHVCEQFACNHVCACAHVVMYVYTSVYLTTVLVHYRDIGSSLRKLTVLWMNNCKLEDLDGISSISQLQVSIQYITMVIVNYMCVMY